MLLAAFSASPAAADITIRLTPEREPRVEVEGIPPESLAALARGQLDRAQWQRFFALYVVINGAPKATPVLGEYKIAAGRLQFAPQFPLKPGLTYRAVFDANALPDRSNLKREPVIETRLSVPQQPRSQPTVVEAVYPSGEALPENLLKFYIHFSAPMSRGGSYRHIRLLDAKGVDVAAPFLELAEELWDPSGCRLTLLLDPGRVKQELKPNKEVGRALAQGNAYTLLIAESWPDAHGTRLAREHRKEFRVVQADTGQPDPKQWKLALPDAGTRQPLAVRLDEPLDHALLQHAVQVSDPAKAIVDGRIEVSDHETTWHFQPETPWAAGNYQLIIDATLEDRAGNSVGRPFEVHLPSGRPTETAECVVPFTIGSN
jgi:hypothetical protein